MFRAMKFKEIKLTDLNIGFKRFVKCPIIGFIQIIPTGESVF